MALRTIDFVRPVIISKVVQESSNIRSFFFEDRTSASALPGQFAMIWLPEVGEFPMSLSISDASRGLSSIAVKAMGEGSRAMYEVSEGMLIGVRGPYGSGFQISKDARRVLLVGGGTGMAPIITLAREVSRDKLGRGLDAKIVIGAKTKQELPFLRAARKYLGTENVFATTDDGSFGFKGLAHMQVEQLMNESKFDGAFSCGPERMLLEVFRIARAKKVPAQLSLERIMKCGIGICGSCCIGDIVLCKDGPVLDSFQLDRVSREFGRYERNKAGVLVPK